MLKMNTVLLIFGFLVVKSFAQPFGDPVDNKTWIEEGRQRDETGRNLGDKFGGDMALDKDQLNAMRSRNFESWVQRWPNGVIPYRVDNSIARYKNWIDQAAAHIRQATGGCIKFVPYTGQADFVNMYNGQGCWSQIGKRRGRQDLSLQLSQTCNWYGVVIHEMMHAAGMSHEHMRSDRDRYLNIYWQNVDRSLSDNFKLVQGQSFGFPFDPESIMLYGPYLFSVNGQKTTSRKDGKYQKDLSEKNSLSPLDISKIKAFYGCK